MAMRQSRMPAAGLVIGEKKETTPEQKEKLKKEDNGGLKCSNALWKTPLDETNKKSSKKQQTFHRHGLRLPQSAVYQEMSCRQNKPH